MTFKPPFGIDKAAHFTTTLIVTACVGLIAGPLAGIAAAAALSVAKEAYDLKYKNATPDACTRDLAADTLGIICAAAVLYFAPLFV